MKRSIASVLALVFAMSAIFTTSAFAAEDYVFGDDEDSEDGYYTSTSYEDVYGSQYNYGGANVVDYQGQELEYGSFSTTQTGVMERTPLPGLQAYVGGEANGGTAPTMETAESAAPELPYTEPSAQGESNVTITSKPVCTKLTESFKLQNGAVGYISIPAIGVSKYYAWEGETTESMKKGLGHFTGTSVWDGNCCFCGHNRGAKYVIGGIKDLQLGDIIEYTTSQGTRTYEVQVVVAIRNDDWSYIRETSDNRITLITCVAGDSSQRWCVQAVQITT